MGGARAGVTQKYQERFKMPEVKTVKGLYDLYLAKGIQLDRVEQASQSQTLPIIEPSAGP
jgi:hypothetical protein